MTILTRFTLWGVLVLAVSPVAAEVVEVSVRSFGPLMPLGPGESGRELMNIGPTVPLDRRIVAVEVVHTEERDVRTMVEGEPRTVPMAYYFVRVRLDRQGYEKLRALQQAFRRQQQAAKKLAGMAMLHIRVAESSQGERFFLNEQDKTAELRLVLHQQQLLPLLNVVQQPWQDEPGASTINRWTRGELDRE